MHNIDRHQMVDRHHAAAPSCTKSWRPVPYTSMGTSSSPLLARASRRFVILLFSQSSAIETTSLVGSAPVPSTRKMKQSCGAEGYALLGMTKHENTASNPSKSMLRQSTNAVSDHQSPGEPEREGCFTPSVLGPS